MAGAIASLAVSLVAKIGNFEKGFQRARKIVSNFSNNLASVATRVAGYAASLFSLLAGGGLAYLVHQQSEAVDTTAKLADTLGLSTEALAAYQYQADISGVSTEQLNASLARYAKLTGMALGGNRAAVNMLAKMGIATEELAGLSADGRFQLLADRYTQIGDASQRATFLQAAFGRGGTRMGALLQEGSKGIMEARKEAEALGVTFNRVDAGKVEAANDSITRLKYVLFGAARTLAFQLSPWIIYAARKLKEIGTEGGGLGAKIVRAFQRTIEAVAVLVDWFEALKAGWFAVQGAIQFGAAVILKPIAWMGKAIQEVYNLWVDIARLFAQTSKGQKFMDLIGIDPKQLRNLKTEFGDGLMQMSEDFRTASVDSAVSATEAWKKFQDGFHQNKARAFFQEILDEADKIGREMADKGKLKGGPINDLQQGRDVFAKNFDLRYTAIGGAGARPEPGPTRDQQGKVIQLLESIDSSLDSAGELLVGA